MKKLILFLSLVVFVSAAQANIPRLESSKKTKPAKETEVNLRIDTRSEMKEPTLVISRKTLKQLRAALDEAEADASLAENIDEAPVAAPKISRIQTFIAGAFFSLAFIIGGVWMFRAKAKSSKITLGLFIIALMSGGAITVFANAPPPIAYQLSSRIFSRLTKTYGYATGKVKVKIVDGDDDRLILHIPKADNDPDLK